MRIVAIERMWKCFHLPLVIMLVREGRKGGGEMGIAWAFGCAISGSVHVVQAKGRVEA